VVVGRKQSPLSRSGSATSAAMCPCGTNWARQRTAYREHETPGAVVGRGLLAPRPDRILISIELLVEKSRTHSKQAFDGWEFTFSTRVEPPSRPTEMCNTCTTRRLQSIRAVEAEEIFADPSSRCHCFRAAGRGTTPLRQPSSA